MLEYVKSAVTRNQSEKKINSLLDYVANSTNTKLLQSFYSTTLERLAEAKKRATVVQNTAQTLYTLVPDEGVQQSRETHEGASQARF